MRKVKIRRLPTKAQGGQSGADQGLRRFTQDKKQNSKGLNQFAAPDFGVNKTISDVPKEEATLEVEHNEFIVAPGMGGIPESYIAKGNRHAQGGINVNLAEGAFVFSDHKTGKKGEKGMKIKDKDILAVFGMSVPNKGKNKGYTPAEIAKKFELNDYKGMLLDPSSDRFERETAELMIANNNLKLGLAGLVQESMKGFPQGIPEISMPVIEHLQMNPEEFMPQQESQEQPMQAQYGAGVIGDPSQYSYQNGGMARRFPGLDVAQRGGYNPLETGEQVLNENNFVKTKMKRNGRVKQKQISEKRFDRIQNRYDRKGGYDGQGNNTTVNRQGTKSVSDMNAGTPLEGYERPGGMSFQPRTRSIEPYTEPDMVNSWVRNQDDEYNSSDYGGDGAFKEPMVLNDRYESPRPKGNYTMQAMDANKEYDPNTRESGKPYKSIGDYGRDIGNFFTGNDSRRTYKQDNISYKDGGAYNGAFWESIMQDGGDVPYAQRGFLKNRRNERRFEKSLNDDSIILDPDNAIYPEDPIEDIILHENYNQPVEVDFTRDKIRDKYNELKGKAHIKIRNNKNKNKNNGSNQLNVNVYNRDGTPSFNQIDETGAYGPNVDAEVSSRSTSTYNVPSKYKNSKKYEEGSSEYVAADIKEGDYVKRDGKWYRATGRTEKLSYHTSSGADNYEGDITADVTRAKKIIAANPDAFSGSGGNYVIKRQAASDLTLEEKDFLTKVLSYNEGANNIGAPGLSIDSQNSGGEPFYGFVDPELIEYKHWKARNGNGTPAEYQALTDDAKKQNRKDYLTQRGYTPAQLAEYEADGRMDDTSLLYNEDFVKGDETTSGDGRGLTQRNQEMHPEGSMRPGEGNDWKYGLEHVDDYGYEDELDWEDAPMIEGVDPADPLVEAKANAPFEPWLQDRMNVNNLAMQRLRAKKYNPNLQTTNFARPDVLYYDPSRALAANAENQNIQNELIRSQGSSASAAAQASGIAGQSMANAANILADYEGRNVQVGNQYLDKVQQTANMENMARSEALSKFFDQGTIANQQYDNTVRAMDRNIVDGRIQLLDDAWEAQAFNQMHDQFNTRPGIGGGMHHTGVRRPFENTGSTGSYDDLDEYSRLEAKGYSKDNIKNYMKNKYRNSNDVPRRGRRNQAEEDFYDGYGRV